MSLFLGHYRGASTDFSCTFFDQNKTSLLTQYQDARVFVVAYSHLFLSTTTQLSDAAFIATEYIKKKQACFEALQGGFACIIWDKRTYTLTLARDPMGQYPLFYSQCSEGEVYLSNAIKPLIDNNQALKTLDSTSIAKFLAVLTPDMTNTSFKHIKKVPYGCVTVFKPNGKRQSSTFWSAKAIVATPLILNQPADYYAAFRALYQTIIRDFLKGKSTIVTHLSGGLDSSSVTNLSAYELAKRGESLDALAHVPKYPSLVKAKPNWNHDDCGYIEAAASFNANTRLHYMQIKKPLFHAARAMHPFMDYPPLNPCNTLWLLEAADMAKRLGADYVLTGQAGNRTISWPIDAKAVMRGRLQRFMRYVPRKMYQYYQTKREGLQSPEPWRAFSGIHPDLAHRVALSQHYSIEVEKRKRLKKDKYEYYADWAFCDYATTFNIGMQQIYGVTQLDPTADRRMVEFCLRIPDYIFEDDSGRSRLLVREGLKGLMPDCVLQRTTRGMQSADWPYWLDAEKETIIDYLHHWRHTDVANYIDLLHLSQLMRKWDLQQVVRSQGKKYQYVNRQYHYKLLRAVEMGLFIEAHA